MPQRHESHFKGFDQTELFFQTWTPATPRGALVITHGLAEHSECYHSLAKTLMEDGWQVFAWDMRGHGRSEGKRGYVREFSYYIKDLDTFVTLVNATRNTDQNLVFLGHSMGGLVTLRFLQTHRADHAALVLSSPAFGLSVAVPKMKEMLAHFAARWAPTLTMYNEIRYEDLSRSEQIIESYQRDPLRHDKVSPGLFLGMVEAFPAALAQAEDIRQPVLMQLSGDDRLVSTPASRELFERMPNRKNQLIVYPESLHEVYNDLDRDQAIADLKKFVNPYLK
ncbi:MAG: lysophospholipase [Bdellovibrionales bacterium]